MKQLHLPITLEPYATFTSYYCATPYSASLIKHLEKISIQQPIILCGPNGAGKTHLLQAACHAHKQQWLFLDGTQIEKVDPSLLENLENQLVCIDNVDHLMNHTPWENALFKLIINHRSQLLFSTKHSPIDAKRQDLSSRFQAMLTLKLPILNEQEQQQAIQHKASAKGLDLNETLINWMQKNLERDNHNLFQLIDKLEKETLRTHRKPSIALLKTLTDHQEKS
jgi:DnaA family protein